MDMSMKSTWLFQPVTLHSSRAFDCEGFTPEQCEYYQQRWHFWYQADWVYALPTVAFFMCCIGIFTISYFVRQIPAFRRGHGPSVWRRLVAGSRYLSYRGFRIDRFNWNSASIGVLLLAAIGTVFFFCMVLVPQPYYWPGSDAVWGNSPPLGTRSGWMALACMPFVFATASKANWITILTGVSHERLQVFHRWISYAFFILALLHTFPFIVWHTSNGDMIQQFFVDNYFTYWTGVVALIFQAWLTFGSFSWIRNLSYEFFKVAHFAAVILFVLVFFWHCGGTLTSWDYFIATAAVYVPCLAFPWLRTLFEYGTGQRAQLLVEDNGFVRISIPANFHWVPGQHCFLRLLKFGSHALTSHPFTICSLPAASSDENSEIVFYVRHRGGFTRKLYEYALKQACTAVPLLVDGPYGGIDDNVFFTSDRLLVIAGGSGAGWSLPLIEQFVRYSTARNRRRTSCESDRFEKDKTTDDEAQYRFDECGLTSIRVILATRDTATRLWFHKRVSDLLAKYAFPSTSVALDVDMYLTGEAERHADEPEVLADLGPSTPSSISATDDVLTEKQGSGRKGEILRSLANQDLHGRPNVPTLIRQEAGRARETNQSLAVFVCGPESMQNDARNAVAAENLDALKNAKAGRGVYLHLEHFSWA